MRKIRKSLQTPFIAVKYRLHIRRVQRFQVPFAICHFTFEISTFEILRSFPSSDGLNGSVKFVVYFEIFPFYICIFSTHFRSLVNDQFGFDWQIYFEADMRMRASEMNFFFLFTFFFSRICIQIKIIFVFKECFTDICVPHSGLEW